MPGPPIEYSVGSELAYELGPVIGVVINGHTGIALLDSGAGGSAVDISLASSLQLAQDGKPHTVTGVTGSGTYPRFQANLTIPILGETITELIPGLPLKENGMILDAIIGRDILCKYEFTFDGRTGRIRFAQP